MSYPNDIESERALLGGLITEPGLLEAAAGRLTEAHFYRPDHAALLTLLRQLRSDGTPIDLVTLPKVMIKYGDAQRFGGVAYVVQLPDHCPSTANLTHYRDRILVAWQARRCTRLADALKGMAQRRDIAQCRKALAEAMAEIDAAGTGDPDLTVAGGFKAAISTLTLLSDNYAQGKPPGVSFGLEKLDELTGTLKPGDLYFLAARPSVGKTALALNMFTSCLKGLLRHSDAPVPYFVSAEMGLDRLFIRVLADVANVPMDRLLAGNLNQSQWERIAGIEHEWGKLDGYSCDGRGLTPDDLCARLHQRAANGPLDVVFIDYLTMLRIKSGMEGRSRAVGDAALMLKRVAGQLGIPIVCLAQLNRAGDRVDKPPQLTDLRDSGELEQHADGVMFLWRPKATVDGEVNQLIELVLAKCRDGRTGSLRLHFNGVHQRFTPWRAQSSRMEN